MDTSSDGRTETNQKAEVELKGNPVGARWWVQGTLHVGFSFSFLRLDFMEIS